MLMRRANGEEAEVVVPLAIPVVQVQIAVGVVPVEVRDHAAVVRMNPRGAVELRRISSVPPPFEYSQG